MFDFLRTFSIEKMPLLSTPMGVDYVVIDFDGSAAISYPQCSLTFMREHYLHRCCEQSFAVRVYAMSAVGIDVVRVRLLFAYRIVSTVCIDVVSSHMKYYRVPYVITR